MLQGLKVGNWQYRFPCFHSHINLSGTDCMCLMGFRLNGLAKVGIIIGEKDSADLKPCLFSCRSGGLDSSSGDLGRADPRPRPAGLPQRRLLRLRDRRDLPGGREPVHPHHGQPGHAAHIHAPGVRRHRPVHHPYPDTLGAVAARFHPTAHQDPT